MSQRARSVCAVASMVLTLAAAVVLVSRGTRASARYVTRDALRSTFESDTRNLVYRWDPADPRPEPERRAALFDFMYQTYDSSAWIPQSVFDGNLMTQAVIGDVDTIVGEKVGLVLWREQSVVPAYGMAPGPRLGPAVALDGELPRLPHRRNRRRRVPRCGHQDLRRPLARRGAQDADERALAVSAAADPVDRAMAAEANRILKSHHHDKIDSLTRARSTAFAASHVELFMRPNGAMPAVEDVGRGDTKTPPLWHTAAKMPSGRWYSDGSFHGPFPAHGFVDGAREGPAVRCAGDVGHPDDQGGVRVGRSAISGRLHTRTRSTRRWRRAERSCSTRRRWDARAAMASTTAGATSTGRASTRTSARIARASTSSRTSSSTRSRRARSPRRARSSRARDTPRRRSPASGRTIRTSTTGACRRCIICSARCQSGRRFFT